MIRKGECNDCGFCCVVIARVELQFTFENDDPRFKQIRGIEPNGTKQVDVVDPCPQHTGIGCRIHSTRPQTCRDFPTHVDEIRGSPCSYWFEDEEGNVIP